MQKVTIFSDGSSLGNPGPGGFGVIISFSNGEVFEIGGFEEKTTNNRMEMTGAIEALSFLESKKIKDCTIVVFTDSQYLINGITKWVSGWERNGWMTKNKIPVLNKDLWQKLSSLVDGKNIEWNYVEGHAGIPGNERVDEIATSFSKRQNTPLFSGLIDDYPVDISNLKPAFAKNKSSSGKKIYSYISMVDGKIESHKTWQECENRVKGKKSLFKKTFSKEEEENIIKEWLTR